MPESGRAEVYFVAGMMVLILIMSVAAVYFFVKTYKKEMRGKELEKKVKAVSQSDEKTNH